MMPQTVSLLLGSFYVCGASLGAILLAPARGLPLYHQQVRKALADAQCTLRVVPDWSRMPHDCIQLSFALNHVNHLINVS